MSVHKYEMGVVGNCSLMAYVDILGNVCWMCLPRFDSYPVFAGLLASACGAAPPSPRMALRLK